jgi:hypothetical protein
MFVIVVLWRKSVHSPQEMKSRKWRSELLLVVTHANKFRQKNNNPSSKQFIRTKASVVFGQTSCFGAANRISEHAKVKEVNK